MNVHRRFFLLTMAVLAALFGVAFGIIGRLQDQGMPTNVTIDAWIPCAACAGLAGCLFFIDLVIRVTPEPTTEEE